MRLFLRLTATILSVCTLIMAVPFSASAASDADFEYTVTDGNATVTAYVGADTNVVIPDQLGGATVTAIGESAFAGNEDLVSVTFPKTLKTIGYDAFGSCTALTAVSFPESLETIEGMAFYDCLSLADIGISPYTYDIGYHAFHNTQWMRDADDGVLYLGRVLYSYVGIIPEGTEITVKYGTAAIAPYAFAQRSNLKGIYLPVGMRTIGEYAFLSCTSLEFVRVPPSVVNIGSKILSGAMAAVFRGTTTSEIAEYAKDNQYHLEYDATLDYPDGDMNKNGKLNSSDVRLLLCVIAGEIDTYDIERYWSCDLKYDGKINTSDVRALLFASLYA